MVFLEKGGRAHSYHLDVTDRHKVYDLAKSIRSEIGDVDILINNAGIVTGRTLMNSPDELIVKTMEVNTISHFWVRNYIAINLYAVRINII